MENEFLINVNWMSRGGNLELLIIPAKHFFNVFLDDQEVCRLRKDKELNWYDLNKELDNYSAEIIGLGIDLYCFESPLF